MGPDASPSRLNLPGTPHPKIDETPIQDDLLERVIKDKETRPEPTVIEVYHLGRLDPRPERRPDLQFHRRDLRL